MIHAKRQAGFTIIELTLATAVFSVILLVITAGIINFTKSYIKGVHQSQTQETARLIMSELSQAVQFSKDPQYTSSKIDDGNGGWQAFCTGNIKYSYRLNQRFKASDASGSHALIRSTYTSGACTPTTSVTSGDTELLGDSMRLVKATNQACDIDGTLLVCRNTDGSYLIHLRIVYGDEDLSPEGLCANPTGSQFCAATELSTTVRPRL